MQALQLRVQELESRLDDEGRDSSDLAVLRERLTEEIEDERRHHQEDIEARDQAIDSTQKRYQGAYLGKHLRRQSLTNANSRAQPFDGGASVAARQHEPAA
jgi:myosin protein heavy chain